MGAVRTSQNPVVTEPIDDVAGSLGPRWRDDRARPAHARLNRARLDGASPDPVRPDDLDAQEQPGAAHVPNRTALDHRLTEPGQQFSTPGRCIGLQPFPVQDVQHCGSGRTGHRIAAKGAEELHPGVEGVGDPASGDQGTHRKPVRHRLAQHHDVGDHTLLLKTPHPVAQTAKARLDFIRHDQSTRRPHRLVDTRQVARRRNDLPTHTRHRLRKKGSRGGSSGDHLCHQRRDISGKQRTDSFGPARP